MTPVNAPRTLALAAAALAAFSFAFAAPAAAESEPSFSSSWLHNPSFEPSGEDPSVGTLTLSLGKDPTPIRYFEVPAATWEEFKNAESPGAFYSANIRQQYERQYGPARAERYDAPFPLECSVDALCAFNEECEDVVIRAIDQSTTSIFIAAYAFTRTRIAAAIVRAKERGVHVEMKMDVNQAKHPGAQRILAMFKEHGIPCTLIHTAGEFSAMHNKFMVFDLRWVVTGSYNFTTQAQVSNWENLVFLDSPPLAEFYRQAYLAIVSDDP